MKKKHLVYLLHFLTYSYWPSFLDTLKLYFFKYLCLSKTYLPARHLLRLVQLQLNRMVFAFLCLCICCFTFKYLYLLYFFTYFSTTSLPGRHLLCLLQLQFLKLKTLSPRWRAHLLNMKHKRKNEI